MDQSLWHVFRLARFVTQTGAALLTAFEANNAKPLEGLLTNWATSQDRRQATNQASGYGGASVMLFSSTARSLPFLWDSPLAGRQPMAGFSKESTAAAAAAASCGG